MIRSSKRNKMPDQLPMRALGLTELSVSSLGLGCSHLASLTTKAGSAEIARLLDAAWDGGIRFFDTADIYGQGDSERALARVASRPGAVICTKAGLKLKVGQTAIRLLKPVLRPILASAKGARNVASRARAASEAHDLDPANITKRLERSLTRLRREHVELFLLHSPPRDALENGELFDLLDQIKARGLAVAVGVSCQTQSDAIWILERRKVEALQVPMTTSDLAASSDLFSRAQSQGVAVIAREVLGGASPADVLPTFLNDPRVTVTLTGTTNIAHLLTNLTIAQGG